MLRAYASGRLFGEAYGEGAPWVLALHGWARTHADFAGVLGSRDGAPALDAVALDLPGFGATPPPPEAWGSGEYADLVVEVLDAMGEKVVVLGHSFGGRVAVELAARHGARVAGLVLTGVPLFRPDGARSRIAPSYRVLRRMARLGLVGEARLEQARQRHGSRDYREATGVMRSVLVRLLSERYEEALGRITCPVGLVWGELDRVAPVEVGRRGAALLGAAAPIVVPGVGHLLPTEAPGRLREALLATRSQVGA